MKNKKEIIPFAATHPGEMIKNEQKERGITQKQFALDMDIKQSKLSETVKPRSFSWWEFRHYT